MSTKPHYHGHRQRLREKLDADPTRLADYEVLELLLGKVLVRKDTKPLAKELLATFSTLNGVFTAKPSELRVIEGFGPSLESYWLLLRELFARIQESPVRERLALGSPKDVAQMARARLGSHEHEEFWAAFLDNQNRLLAWERISSGTVNSTMVYPRDLMEQTLKHKASSIVIVHNHPGGNPAPSTPDITLTQQIDKAAKSLGVRLLDHLIVTDETYFSMKDDGLF